MNNAATSCGVSELGDEICLKGVTPCLPCRHRQAECFYRGSTVLTTTLSKVEGNRRLKHAGMTEFG